MRTLLTLSFFVMVSTGICQNAPDKPLRMGQKIKVVITTTMDAEMSMGMQMKNESSSTNLLEVIAASDKSYTITNTLTKVNIGMNAMGQEQSYDSEK